MQVGPFGVRPGLPGGLPLALSERGKNYLVTPHDGPAEAKRFDRLEVTGRNPQGIGAGPSS